MNYKKHENLRVLNDIEYEYGRKLNDNEIEINCDDSNLWLRDCFYLLAFRKMNRPIQYDKLYWVTVNPMPSVSLDRFKELLMKFSKRVKSIDCHYTLEQRGETKAECGKGFHAHILFKQKKGYSPTECKRDTYNTFKSVLGNPKAMDFKVYPFSYWDDKINYLWGNKDDIEKSQKLGVDAEWRIKYNLDRVYINASTTKETT